MKRFITVFATTLLVISTAIFAQSNLKEYKVGHIFYVILPDYMSKTVGLNNAAVLQYKSVVKDVYGFIVEDNKSELTLAELHYSSINEFFDDFIKDFLKDEDNRILSKPKFQKKGDISFAECDITYSDKNAKIDIYYLVGIVETKLAYYKVLSWSAAENKDKFKADFEKILYSLKD